MLLRSAYIKIAARYRQHLWAVGTQPRHKQTLAAKDPVNLSVSVSQAVHEVPIKVRPGLWPVVVQARHMQRPAPNEDVTMLLGRPCCTCQASTSWVIGQWSGKHEANPNPW